MSSKEGVVRLSDGAVLRLKVVIVDAREAGFSPYGGVNIFVKPIGGLSVKEIPENLRNEMRDKPIASGLEPRDGWEIIDIEEFEPATDEMMVKTSKGLFLVKVKAEPVMAARNMGYKPAPELNEPLYSLNWVYKVSWKPIKEE